MAELAVEQKQQQLHFCLPHEHTHTHTPSLSLSPPPYTHARCTTWWGWQAHFDQSGCTLEGVMAHVHTTKCAPSTLAPAHANASPSRLRVTCVICRRNQQQKQEEPPPRKKEVERDKRGKEGVNATGKSKQQGRTTHTHTHTHTNTHTHKYTHINTHTTA